jgi:hypothetical protein
MTEFEEYLTGKKIDPERFKKKKPEQYDEFERVFMQMHPSSFTSQKLFLINQIRRDFPYKGAIESKEVAKKPKMKPKITPRRK